jgi:hypothetical protein
MEDLLTSAEIKGILEEAKNPEYADPLVLHLAANKTSIRRTCSKTGIVLINGNHWTGYQHIMDRHSLTSRIPYWEGDKLGNPSKFPLGLTAEGIVNIASTIFHKKNISYDRNKSPDIFDIYIASYATRENELIKFSVVTYKETGIIHTFYVSDNRKPFNKKKILDLRQGWFSESYDCMRCIKTLTMSYYDSANIEKFKVIARYIEPKNVQRWYIQVNSEAGEPIFTTLIKEDKLSRNNNIILESQRLNFSDVSWIEKIIKRITNNTL